MLKTMKVQLRRRPTLTSRWRWGYEWRWNRLYPVASRNARWWACTATTLNKIQDQAGFDQEMMIEFLSWFWAWKSFSLTEARTISPNILSSLVDEFKTWYYNFRHAIAQWGVAGTAARYYPHRSDFTAPWECEDIDD